MGAHTSQVVEMARTSGWRSRMPKSSTTSHLFTKGAQAPCVRLSQVAFNFQTSRFVPLDLKLCRVTQVVPTKRKPRGADEGDALVGQSNQLDLTHPQLIQPILSHQVATLYTESATQVLIGTGSQGMLSLCRGFTCILNHVFRRDSP